MNSAGAIASVTVGQNGDIDPYTPLITATMRCVLLLHREGFAAAAGKFSGKLQGSCRGREAVGELQASYGGAEGKLWRCCREPAGKL